jgi:hypothetical protein
MAVNSLPMKGSSQQSRQVQKGLLASKFCFGFAGELV